MISEQLLNVMKMFGESSLYKEFTTSSEITSAVHQLSQGKLNNSREKYVLSCLFIYADEALDAALKKYHEPKDKAELSLLKLELAQLQLALLSPEETKH